jgi:hypothetical protein
MRTRFSAWLALLAISGQLAWPIAATAAANPALQGSICSVAGSAPAPDQQSLLCRLHCALRFVGGERLAILQPPQMSRPADVPVLLLPRRPALAREESSAAVDADARAPPARS